jgi:hypothetical protein
MSVRDQRVGTSHSDKVTEEEKENEVSHNVEQSKDSTMQMVSLRGSVRVPATVLVSDGIVKKRNFFQTILGE